MLIKSDSMILIWYIDTARFNDDPTSNWLNQGLPLLPDFQKDALPIPIAKVPRYPEHVAENCAWNRHCQGEKLLP